MDSAELETAVVVAIAIVFGIIAAGFLGACVWAIVEPRLLERRAERLAHWSDEDTRAVHLHAQSRGYER